MTLTRAQQTRRERYRRTTANGGIAPIPEHRASTYANWGCRCVTCTADWAESVARGRQQRFERTQRNGGVAPAAVHNANTYTNWRCGCRTCLDDHSARHRRWRAAC